MVEYLTTKLFMCLDTPRHDENECYFQERHKGHEGHESASERISNRLAHRFTRMDTDFFP